MSYQSIAQQMWNFSACFAVREENILRQIFVTNGNAMDWNKSGELVYWSRSIEDNPKEPESLAQCALEQQQGTDKKKLKPFDAIEASFWFDFYHVEMMARQQAKVFVGLSHPDSAPYNMLWKIPDNITDEWVKVVNRCIKWLEKIDEESYTTYNLSTMRKSWFGCTFDKYKPQVLEAHPELAAVELAHKDRIKDITDVIDRCMFHDPEWLEAHAKICQEIRKITQPLADENVKKDFGILQDIIKFAKERLTSLGKNLDDVSEPLILTRDLSIPSWYVKPEDRPEKRLDFELRGDGERCLMLDNSCCVAYTLEELKGFLPWTQ